jgi:hypothetical protein
MVEAIDVAAGSNVIVTLPEATFREARRFLRRWGEVHRTGYFHVLTLTVEDVESFPAEVAEAIGGEAGYIQYPLPYHPGATRPSPGAAASCSEATSPTHPPASARPSPPSWTPMTA